MKKIDIIPSYNSHATELYFGEGLIYSALLADLCKKRKNQIVIVADAALRDRCAAKLAHRLDAHLITIPSGEKSKTNETVERIEEELFREKYGQDTTLVALGGGVTTDLTGFIASIYMRGIDLILIPTTLLAMVDASIGGKTGIDTAFGKNLIGTTYHPRAIIDDLDILKTLPEKEWFNGLAEILKIGLIADASIWKIAEEEIKNNELILKAIQAKIDIIQKDSAEKGLRRVLNYGHTIGHALETVSNYETSHGEAVAIGCVIESHLSMKLGYLSVEQFEEIQSTFNSFSLKLASRYDRTKLIAAMMHDKKNINHLMRFVLIDRIGHTIPFDGNYCRPVSEEELISTLAWMEKTYG